MLVYHVTSFLAAVGIWHTGFRDGVFPALQNNGEPYQGVWVSDVPFDEANPHSAVEIRFVMDIPATLLLQYEWAALDKGWGYREALIPARSINQYGRPYLVLNHRSVND